MRPPESGRYPCMTALPLDETHARRRRPAPGTPGPALTFADFGVPAPRGSSLAQAGILTPFPIQAAALPDALAGVDILGRGRTGSGKTLAFSIPLVAGLAGGH